MTHHPPSKILVGVDFSPESDAAIAHAMSVARTSGGEVVLLHACTVPEPPALLGDYAPPALGEYRARVEADVAADRGRLEELRVRLSGQGVTVSQMVADGFPDTTITQVAHELGADLTVVGTHGRTGIKWLFLGSVAQRVVRLADSDVLVARGVAQAGGYHKICVATDFSASAELALEAALDVAHLGATVDVVHFWHLAPRLGFYEPIRLASLEEWRGSLDSEMKAAGGRLISAHRRPGLSLGFQAVFEPVLPGLQTMVEQGGYDLVALGSHGRRGFRRFVLGSVAEEIARRAPCSVLVAHGAEADREEAAA